MSRIFILLVSLCVLTACDGIEPIPFEKTNPGATGKTEAGAVETPAMVDANDTGASVKKPAGGGLFGRPAASSGAGRAAFAPRSGDPDYREIELGTALRFGEVARLCGTPARQLGTVVEKAGGFSLIDSQPAASGPRPHYLSGFKDGCVRQFTASYVLISAPDSYEILRYGPAGKTLPITSVAKAYETIKSKVCNVRAGKPCGRSIGRLSRKTIFITAYERFGGGDWLSMLLHDGKLEAMTH